MVTVTDLQKLIVNWQERLENPLQTPSYKDAVGECIFELNNVISHSIEEELSYQEFLDKEADAHFSNLEPEEFYAAAV